MISTGSCHCGRVRFEVVGAPAEVTECNCSICTKKAYLHWFVPRSDFRLLTPETDLATYTFHTGKAKHHFCKVCGVAPFYIARSHPDAIDVNVRCLDAFDPKGLPRRPFDGRNWERSIAELTASTDVTSGGSGS